ncbi:MAG: hypothetical protein HKM28_05760, partial [Flavobacteriaceae bacterium]|nr:hypothetical protein [Flavobacteriaceae bacterium]
MNDFTSTYQSAHFSPYTWWLHLGNCLFGDVLIVGNLDHEAIGFLQQYSKELTQVHLTTEAAQKSKRIDNSHKTASSLSELTTQFDAIIIDGFLNQVGDDTLSQLSHQRLKDTGKLCLYEASDYTIAENWRKPFKLIANLIFDQRRRMLFRKVKQLNITCFPSMTEDGKPYESFINKQYSSNKNSFLLKQKIKKLIYNSRLSRLFSNSNIWIIGNDNSELLVDLVKTSMLKLDVFDASRNLRCAVIYYKRGKMIFTFIDANDAAYPGAISVLALDKEALSQRLNELKIVKLLAQEPHTRQFVQANYHISSCM